MPTSDVTVSAHYKQISYTVSVENGSADQQSYHAGDQVTIKSIIRRAEENSQSGNP